MARALTALASLASHTARGARRLACGVLPRSSWVPRSLCIGVLVGIGIAIATRGALRDFPRDPEELTAAALKSQVLTRDGTPLNFTLENQWNVTDRLPLSAVPILLQKAFLAAEDGHFYEHHGVDWRARLAAVWQNTRAGAEVRGASTITEQVVRMIHPRPRSLWSKWIEGFEASGLDERWSKAEILEFYLNQVPYAERRRGVSQAARFYYDRDLQTLSPAEQLSLAVLVRSPAGLDLRRNRPRAERAIQELADRLARRGDIDSVLRDQLHASKLVLDMAAFDSDTSHFSRFVLDAALHSGQPMPRQIRTTLDLRVQQVAQQLLNTSLATLARRHVEDGAVLVIDNQRNEIEAWVVGGATATAVGYDTILTPRQPGSTMKPLLYALALEQGWTAATLIDDSELSESVAGGQHTFHNYSHKHYGPLRLREALGNSLNIPAVKALQFVGQERFLDRLRTLGVQSLAQQPEYYGDGLALGNGEVSVYEMAQAYTALARRGRFSPLTYKTESVGRREESLEFSPEAASLIGNILSDPEARMLEFGKGLQFPIETAVKTGTSTDYRDAWAIAFDYRHTVAVWMGNLDGSPMDGVTGAVGPAMVLRSVFSLLNRDQDTQGLYLSPRLASVKICRRDGRLADGVCDSADEWFLPGTAPLARGSGAQLPDGQARPEYRLLQPTAGLNVARDPRIPAEFEALPMSVSSVPPLGRVDWFIDGRWVSSTNNAQFAWPLTSGPHEVYARIWDAEIRPHPTDAVRIYVR